MLITKEAKCLSPVDEEDEDEVETDAKVWDPIADMIPRLSKILRASF